MASPKLQGVLDLAFPGTLVANESPAASLTVQEEVLALFHECGPGVRRYVASFNLAGTATEDVVQDVFLALFRHLSLGRPSTNLKGWLFQVAHNLALKQRQRTTKRGLLETAWDTAFADRVLDAGLNPEERLAERERQQRLVGVMKLMPERDQRDPAQSPNDSRATPQLL